MILWQIPKYHPVFDRRRLPVGLVVTQSHEHIHHADCEHGISRKLRCRRVLKALCVIFASSVMAYFVFHLNILSLGVLPLLAIIVNLIFFGFSFGVLVLGLIFKFGTKINAFAWGLITLFQPLMAVIYPVSVLPEPFRSLSLAFPPTHVFEASRMSLAKSPGMWNELFIALILNIVFCIGTVLFFNAMFRNSRESGQFARLEG
jgi:ABC-2 type transport system permease protein